MSGKVVFEQDTKVVVDDFGRIHQQHINLEEEVIQINVPRNQAVVIMDGENVIGVLATHQTMKGWKRKHMADYILKKLKKGNQNGQ